MSTFDSTPEFDAPNPPRRWRTVAVWLAITATCGLFAAVYQQFARGVVSWWMVFAFAWPLIGAVLPYSVIALRQADTRIRYPWSRVLHATAIASLTLGSVMTGVFQIFGSTSDYVIAYWILGGTLLIAAGVSRFVTRPRTTGTNDKSRTAS